MRNYRRAGQKNEHKFSFFLGVSVSGRLTLKALWDGKRPIIAGGNHRVATPVGLVHAVEGDMLSMENPVRL